MKEFKVEKGCELIIVKLGAYLETINTIQPNWLIAIVILLILYFLAKREKMAFEENDSIIPLPIRSLDFGIKAAKKLEQMIAKD